MMGTFLKLFQQPQLDALYSDCCGNDVMELLLLLLLLNPSRRWVQYRMIVISSAQRTTHINHRQTRRTLTGINADLSP